MGTGTVVGDRPAHGLFHTHPTRYHAMASGLGGIGRGGLIPCGCPEQKGEKGQAASFPQTRSLMLNNPSLGPLCSG